MNEQLSALRNVQQQVPKMNKRGSAAKRNVQQQVRGLNKRGSAELLKGSVHCDRHVRPRSTMTTTSEQHQAEMHWGYHTCSASQLWGEGCRAPPPLLPTCSHYHFCITACSATVLRWRGAPLRRCML